MYSAESSKAKVDFDNLDHAIIHRGITKKAITAIKTRYMTTHKCWMAVNEDVCRIEQILGIEHRWTPDSAEYTAALTVLHEQKYRRALDHLERLVVQCLFELTKLGMSGIGMFDYYISILPSSSCSRLQAA